MSLHHTVLRRRSVGRGGGGFSTSGTESSILVKKKSKIQNVSSSNFRRHSLHHQKYFKLYQSVYSTVFNNFWTLKGRGEGGLRQAISPGNPTVVFPRQYVVWDQFSTIHWEIRFEKYSRSSILLRRNLNCNELSLNA